MTPPETLRLVAPSAGSWSVRVVPNLYPAFEHHEVVVHTPRHARSLAELSDGELSLVAEAWRSRSQTAGREGFPYVHALLNEGAAAGASLPHTHSQLVWLDSPPPAVTAEERRSCPVCELLARELGDGRHTLESRGPLAVIAHPAGRAPYELLLAPVTHDEQGLASELLGEALSSLASWLRRLHAIEGAIPVNAWIHTNGHWHIELLPRLTVFGGIELGAGIYVNTLAPEEAARRLRAAPLGA
ncbi:MAG: hypothetical protein H0T09_04635 [Actinobacteria bacterium]|nr:hypothetical protein [Actinomycetota bacterium]